MAVYVDDYRGSFSRGHRAMVMCHMLADSLDELHAFAARLGLKREWFQPRSAPHYDLSLTKRAEALQLGAVNLPIHVNGKPNPEWRRVLINAKKLPIEEPRDKRNKKATA